MWYIFLCVLTVLSSSNSSLLMAGNYFLRKAQFVLEKQVIFCYKPQCYSPIWWSNLKKKPLLNLGAGFLQRWKQPLSFPAWSWPMVPSAGNNGAMFHATPLDPPPRAPPWCFSAVKSELEIYDGYFEWLRGGCCAYRHEVQVRSGCRALLLLLIYDLWKVPIKRPSYHWIL